MKSLITTLSLLAFGASAQISPEWVRYPAISPDGATIAFTYKGDIYSVPSQGGQAQRLTYHTAHDYKPVWSSDGSKLAFASARFGNFDVYVMDALGGEATRLTYHSIDEEPYTFTPDNKHVVFKGQRMDTAEHRQYPSGRQAELYSVPVTGGIVDQVFTIPAEDVQFSSDGKAMLYHDNKGYENPWRKHHKSAIARDIWRVDLDSGKHTQITQFDGEDRNPIFSSDNKSMYYLSESSGSFNVHKLNINRPKRSEQLTEFNLHPVRFLSMGNDTLAFSYHGELYTMKDGDKPSKVNISIRYQDLENSQELVSIGGKITEMAISPNGKELAYIANGDVFVSSQDGAFTKQITHTAAQESDVSFSPEGDFLLYSAERDSKWSIIKATKVREQEPFFYAASLIEETPLIDNDKDNYQGKVSPDGKSIAFVEDRKTLRVMDLASQKVTTLLGPEHAIHFSDSDQHFSWSPDSNWILFEDRKLLNNSDVSIVSAKGGEAKRVLIPSGYYDRSPEWSQDGKQIIWFSNREGLKSYATSGTREFDVYALFLTQDAWDKFNLSEDDYNLMKAIEEANEEETEESSDDEQKDEDASEEEVKEEAVEAIDIEFDGLERRVARLTIHSSQLSDAVINKDADTLYYLSKFEDNYDLWQTNLRTQETKKTISLGARGGSLHWDKDMENLYLLSAGSIAKLDLEGGAKEGVSINAQMEVDHDAIAEQAFDHVWLRTSKIFYEPTFHGVDWKLMKAEYQPKVKHTANAYEFTELLSEMLGELNVSHSGAGYRGSMENADDTASLGIFYDYEFDGNGIKITEIIKDGPLDKAKFDIEPGMIIQKINGKTITKDIDWASMLNRQANQFVLLDIYKPQDKSSQQITVKPIDLNTQSDLLYRRFVKINEQEVLERSKGQLGYVHIPGMSDGPYRSIFDDMMGRFFDKKGMVVDTRFNGGGDLVADLAMFFTGEPFISYAIEGHVVGGEPTSRYTKPIIGLFNESMYSDGHCYASGFTDLKLGKSVGMPVPGTCSFAGWESLPTGGYWGIVPVSAKNKAGEWMENNQTTPDIIIKNEPGVIDAGRDQQLEVAIDELLEEVD